MRLQLALAALTLTACAHASAAPGAAPDATALRAHAADIRLCSTLEATLRAWFGEPSRNGRQSELRLLTWALGGHPERILVVALDSRGVAVDLAWDTPGVASWIPADRCAGRGPAPQ